MATSFEPTDSELARPNGRDTKSSTLTIVSPSDGADTDDAMVWPGGVLLAAEFVPGAGGVQPTDASGLQIRTAAGSDILCGEGANLSNTTVKRVCPLDANGMPVAIATGTPLTIVWENAGNSKQMTVVLTTK